MFYVYGIFGDVSTVLQSSADKLRLIFDKGKVIFIQLPTEKPSKRAYANNNRFALSVLVM